MKLKLIVDGGSMKPGPAVAQQLGPMGINMGKVIQDVNTATSGFKGTKVPVELDIDKDTKDFTIKVFSPPTSELIKKEIKVEKASGLAGKTMVGNISVEQLIGIAKTKMSDMLAKDIKAALKLTVGSCTSAGILVDSKNPKEIMADIEAGKYDSEISSEKTLPDAEKQKKLEQDFAEVKANQEKVQKAKEEEAAKLEAEKAEAATAAPGKTSTAPAATPVAAKKEEKPKKK